MDQNFLLKENIFDKEELSYFIKKYDSLIPDIPFDKYCTASKIGFFNFDIEKNKNENNLYLDPVVLKLKQVISFITKLPIDNQETPNLLKYHTGGKYKRHYDYIDPMSSSYDSEMKERGQREFTSILYLNDNFEGGETNFPLNNLTIKPKTGLLLTWRNINVDGSLNKNSLHEGMPVVTGNKYIIVIWTRQKNLKNIL